jgi:hypothetical protein
LEKPTFVTNLAVLRKRKILLIRLCLALLWVILVAFMWLSKAHVGAGFRYGFKTSAILALAGVVYASVAAIGRLTRSLGLNCPQCDRSLGGPQSANAVRSGTCFHCGADLF